MRSGDCIRWAGRRSDYLDSRHPGLDPGSRKKVFFASEVMVERTFGQAGSFQNGIQAGSAVPGLVDFHEGQLEESSPGALGIAGAVG